VEDIGAQDAVLAGQRVDHDLGTGHAIGEIEERPPASRDAVPLDLGRLVEPRGAEADARHVGLLHSLLEGHRRAARADHAALEHDLARVACNSGATTDAIRALISSQAAFTAMPFRSLPELAAVAEVFGTFAVSVAVIFTRSIPTPNRSAATCATFWNRPWPISVPPWFMWMEPSW
jgi:hypothetical protein